MPNSVPANCRVLAKGGEAVQAFVSFARGQMCLLVITLHVASLILRGTHITNTYAFPISVITGQVGGGSSMLAKQCALQKKWFSKEGAYARLIQDTEEPGAQGWLCCHLLHSA